MTTKKRSKQKLKPVRARTTKRAPPPGAGVVKKARPGDRDAVTVLKAMLRLLGDDGASAYITKCIDDCVMWTAPELWWTKASATVEGIFANRAPDTLSIREAAALSIFAERDFLGDAIARTINAEAAAAERSALR